MFIPTAELQSDKSNLLTIWQNYIRYKYSRNMEHQLWPAGCNSDILLPLPERFRIAIHSVGL
jgi:hypothetical protein